MMQSVQRRFGKAQTADEGQVSGLMKDFDEADRMLTKVSLPLRTTELARHVDAPSSSSRRRPGETRGEISWHTRSA